jgi:hypothetical protein
MMRLALALCAVVWFCVGGPLDEVRHAADNFRLVTSLLP